LRSGELDEDRLLQNISADLAHASITFRADESAIPGLVQDSVSTDILLAEISVSASRGGREYMTPSNATGAGRDRFSIT
jgi:hypothetical protein